MLISWLVSLSLSLSLGSAYCSFLNTVYYSLQMIKETHLQLGAVNIHLLVSCTNATVTMKFVQIESH